MPLMNSLTSDRLIECSIASRARQVEASKRLKKRASFVPPMPLLMARSSRRGASDVLNEQHQRDCSQRQQAQEPELIEEGEQRCLLLHRRIDKRLSARKGVFWRQTGGAEFPREASQRRGGRRAVGRGAAAEPASMQLHAPGEHRRDEGDSEAAAQISEQVDQTRSPVVFLRRQVRVGGQIERDKYERYTEPQDHARY